MANYRKNWIECKLSDILVSLESGKRPKGGVDHYDQGIPSLGGEHLSSDGRFNFSKIRFIPLEFLQKMTSGLIERSDILVVKDGATTGRTSFVENQFPYQIAAINEHLFRLKIPRYIEAKWIFYQLWSQTGKKQILQDFRGAAQGGITKKFSEYVRVFLPPIAEQKRIVAKIEELFSEIDKGIENLLKAQELLKAYQQSLIRNAATGGLLISLGLIKNSFDDSCKINLSKVISEHGQGWSPKCLNEPSTNENDWAVIKTTAIQNFEFLEDENKLLPKNLKPKPHLEIVTGDILVTRAGPRNRVGIACLVRECRKRLILCDKAYRIKVNQDMILPEYLEMLLNSPHIIDKIEYLKTGINDSGVNLTQERFLALELIVPPLSLQKLTLKKLQDNISIATQLNQQINIASEKLKNIRQSILKIAFSGELVSQDATDESASILLERITAEKEIPKPPKKKSKQLQKVTT